MGFGSSVEIVLVLVLVKGCGRWVSVLTCQFLLPEVLVSLLGVDWHHSNGSVHSHHHHFQEHCHIQEGPHCHCCQSTPQDHHQHNQNSSCNPCHIWEMAHCPFSCKRKRNCIFHFIWVKAMICAIWHGIGTASRNCCHFTVVATMRTPNNNLRWEHQTTIWWWSQQLLS